MKDYLEHIRLVHLSAMVVLATSLYLAVVGWTRGNLLEKQLRQLSADVRGFTTTPPETSLNTVIPRWDYGPSTALRARLEKGLGGPVVLSGESKVALVLSRFPTPSILEHTSIDSIRKQFETTSWNIQIVDSVDIDWARVKRRINQYFGNEPSVVRPSVDFKVMQWSTGSRGCVADVSFIQEFVASGTRERPPLVITQESAACFTHVDTISAPLSMFAGRYPVIAEYWDSIGSRSRANAIEWASHIKSERLRESKPTLAGLTIEGGYVALVAPTLLLALFAYMLALLRHVNEPSGVIPEAAVILRLSPWVGTMSNYWARTVSWATLVVLPFFSTTALLWNQRHIALVWSTLAGLLVAAVGLACVQAGSRVAAVHTNPERIPQ